ncbi:MAG: hypothetical protein WC450_08635 [Candidatus Omnitrophota bacterium]|jgi:hypothetical protein
MTKETEAREHWKNMLRMFGKKSKEELAAYKAYIKIRTGQGSKAPRQRRTLQMVPKQLFQTEELWKSQTSLSI